MRRAKDILKDLGFNADAPMATKEAFLRHLVRAAQVQSQPSQERQTQPEKQLSFDAEILGIQPIDPKSKA
jgi:hypothetical protein